MSDALSRIGVGWDSFETLQLIQDVSIRCHQSAIAFIDEAQRAAVGIPGANPDGFALPLIRSVVEALLIPDTLPPHATSQEELLRIYWSFQAFEHGHADVTPMTLNPKNPWTIRCAVQSLWRDAFREVGCYIPPLRPASGSSTWWLLQRTAELLAEYRLLCERTRITFDYPTTYWRQFVATMCNVNDAGILKPAMSFVTLEHQKLRERRGWQLRAALSNRPIAIEPPAIAEIIEPPALVDKTLPVPPTKSRGRPSMSEADASQRRELLASWDTAAAAGVTRKIFCTDRCIAPETLNRAVNWRSQQKTRSRMTK